MLKNLFTSKSKWDKKDPSAPNTNYEMKNKQTNVQKAIQNAFNKDYGNYWKKMNQGKSPQIFQYASVIINNNMYIHGGCDWALDVRDVNNLIEFSLTNYTWRYPKPSESPPPRARHTAIVWNDMMVIHGGQSANTILADTWIYRIVENKWTQQPYKSPKPAVFDHSAVLYDNAMWIFGGKSTTRTFNCNVYRMNIMSGYWDFMEPNGEFMPGEITGHSAHVVGDKMYVFGGCVDDEPQNDVYCFNFITKMWHVLDCNGDIPHPRYNHLACVLNSQVIYLFSGANGKNCVTASDAYMLDLGIEKWKRLHVNGEPFPPRSGAIALSLRNSIWTFGGWNGKLVCDDLQEFRSEIVDPPSLIWNCVRTGLYIDLLITIRETDSIRMSGPIDLMADSARRSLTLPRRMTGLNAELFVEFQPIDPNSLVLDLNYMTKRKILFNLNFKFETQPSPLELLAEMTIGDDQALFKDNESIGKRPVAGSLVETTPIDSKMKIQVLPVGSQSFLTPNPDLSSPTPNGPKVPKYKNASLRKIIPTTPTRSPSMKNDL